MFAIWKQESRFAIWKRGPLFAIWKRESRFVSWKRGSKFAIWQRWSFGSRQTNRRIRFYGTYLETLPPQRIWLASAGPGGGPLPQLSRRGEGIFFFLVFRFFFDPSEENECCANFCLERFFNFF
jgi:hypothetical protein